METSSRKFNREQRFEVFYIMKSFFQESSALTQRKIIITGKKKSSVMLIFNNKKYMSLQIIKLNENGLTEKHILKDIFKKIK